MNNPGESIYIDDRRIRSWNERPLSKGGIVYWMSRDQRVNDNWALLYAQKLALTNEQPLIVMFNLVPSFLGATLRQYRFMLKGLRELKEKLTGLNIDFYLLTGEPEEEIPNFCQNQKAGALVTDFSPLRIYTTWKAGIAEKLDVAFFEVDAHNLVPCWVASPKLEYAAYTLRPKLKRLLPEFLTGFPQVTAHPWGWNKKTPPVPWVKGEKNLDIDRSVGEAREFKPGEKAGLKAMDFFLTHRLYRYHKDRNDPNKEGQSNLSPYLHFGLLSAQRLAHEVYFSGKEKASVDSFLEELIVRRELSDNYCFYNEFYDSVEGFPRWGRESLEKHQKDPRTYQYPVEVFERGKTHDPLWNAAQKEMVITGKMHGYMRMYWAKKILEWTDSPQRALEIAIYLNDKYSLDGRDPNGYAGIAWSIGGVHDRAWAERPVLGKIRYMSYKGTKKKFKVKDYIEKVESMDFD